MTDNPVESAPETQESGGLPTPDFSAASEGQPTSEGKSVDVEEIVQKVVERLTPEIEKRTQSVKDRRISKLEQKQEELARAAGLLKDHGGDTAKAAREAVLLELAEELPTRRQSESTPSSHQLPGKEQMEKDYDEEIDSYLRDRGIDLPPDEIREATKDMAGLRFTSVSKAVAKAAAMIDAYRENKAKQQAPGSPGAAGGLRGGPAPEPGISEFKKEMLGARGKGSAVGNAIREKYRKLGVDIDSVSF